MGNECCNVSNNMTLAERKKEKKKDWKQKIVNERRSDIKKQEGRDKQLKTKSGSCGSKVDNDPDGKELLKLDALGESAKYSCILVRHGPHRYTTWTLRYDVAMTRGKKIMALQALIHAKDLDSRRSELFDRIVHFAQNHHWSYQRGNIVEDDSLYSDVEKILNYGMGKLLAPHISIQEFVINAALMLKADPTTPLKMRISVCRAYHIYECGSVDDAASLIISGIKEGRGFNVDTCREALKCLQGMGNESTKYVSKWEEWIKSRYPLAFK